ncbi:MAG TPA: type II secretion system protein [Candidatus Saccharimonadales bacterium]|nr:type II secretion system protein [Candidatus Saccharimonadales bacterium]
MNRYRPGAGGYTILEVVIVLTVSSILFAAAVVGYSAQNRRTQFTQSVQNFAQDIQDILNDVESGFYPSTNNFRCVANPSGGYPTFPSGAAEQGTNTDCIFLGKAIQFAPAGGSASDIDIYTVVGRRLVSGTREPVTSIDDARPIGLNQFVERKSLISGIEVESVETISGDALAGFAMVSSSESGDGDISSGLNARASLATVPGALHQAGSVFRGDGGGSGVALITNTNINQANGGIRICLREGGGRGAIIELATGRSQIIVDTKIDQSC